jgi:soluble lytic murein transglycosylase-like protein
MTTEAQKIAALGIMAGAGWLLWRWWNPPGQVEVIDGARLDYSPLLETFDNAWPDIFPGVNVLDTNEQLRAAGFDPYATATASAGGAQVIKKNWVTTAAGAEYEPTFIAASKKYGIPDGLLSRMAYQESRFRPEIIDGRVRSPAGATGIMQLMPVHFKNVNPVDPHAAIMYAGSIMKGWKRQFGSWDKALAAYNWGPGNLAKWLAQSGENWLQGMNRETYNYVTQIATDTGIYPAGIGGSAAGIA